MDCKILSNISDIILFYYNIFYLTLLSEDDFEYD